MAKKQNAVCLTTKNIAQMKSLFKKHSLKLVNLKYIFIEFYKN